MADSMTLEEFIAYLPGAKSKVISSIEKSIYLEAEKLIKEFKDRSPIDKNVFRNSWFISINSPSADLLYSVNIYNNTVYGEFIDEGGVIGGVPWYWPNTGNKGKQFKGKKGKQSASRKLIIRNGKVWAGGQSPAGFVIGGITNPILFDSNARQNEIAGTVADGVIGAI